MVVSFRRLTVYRRVRVANLTVKGHAFELDPMLIASAAVHAGMAGGKASGRRSNTNKASATNSGFGPQKKSTEAQPKRSARGQSTAVDLIPLDQMLLRALNLQDVWPQLNPRVPGFEHMMEAFQTGSSSTHGIGLFANPESDGIVEDAPISFYPVHALGRDTRCFVDEVSRPYFDAKGSASYRVNPSHRSLDGWADDFWIDANPTLEDQPGWLGHRANDAATLPPYASETDILEYYARCREVANAVLVPFGDAAPIMCLWSLRPIAPGEEIFQIYGHDYWIKQGGGVVPPYTDAVLRAAKACWKDFVVTASKTQRKELDSEVVLLEGLMRV